MDTDQRVAFLKERSVFGGLGAAELRALSYLLREVMVEDQDLLFAEGDAGAEAYIVVSGCIDLVETAAGSPRRPPEGGTLGDGKVCLRMRCLPGQLFGELALFGNGRRALGARASGPTRLWAIGEEAFSALIRAHPAVALALLRLQTERFLDLERQYRLLRDASCHSD